MSKQDQAPRQRAGRAREGVATIAAASGLAVGLALLGEALAWLLGMAAGHPDWHRGWVDALLLGQPLASPPLLRDLLGLAAALFLPCLLAARHVGHTLVARYDGAALCVESPRALAAGAGEPAGGAQRAAWNGLASWCEHGSGPGNAPLWHPGALPAVEQRLSVAVLTGGSDVEKSRLAEAFSRHIDGTVRLHALGSRLQGLRWRLRIKLDECCWWKPLPAGTPWDAGYLPLSPDALAPLRAFRPRRATLIVADGLHEQLLREVLRTLGTHQAAFRHAVRLLVIADPGDAVVAMCRDGAAAASWQGPRRSLPAVPVFDLQAP